MALSEVGIANLGNTCFLNSVLQGLLKCQTLYELFGEESKFCERYLRQKSKKRHLIPAFQELWRSAHSAEDGDCLVPRSFLKALWTTVQECDDDWFRPRQQADSAECLQYLLEGIHDALYRQVHIDVIGTARSKTEENQIKALESWKTFFSKEYSPIVGNFYGQSEFSVVCQTCKTVSTRYEPWLILKIPIPGGDKEGTTVPTMDDCLNALFEPEIIADYACDTCKSKQMAIKHERISKLPNTLLLSFKRFTNTGAKIRGKITWNLEKLSLQPWVAFDRSPFTNKRQYPSFRTFTVIEHQGSAQGGHYHMYGRSTNEGSSWNNYDDCSVRKSISETEIITADSYIIFLETESKP